MVTSRLGLSSNAEYLLYSKFSLLYDFIPVSLTPLVVAKDYKKMKQSNILNLIVIGNALLVTIAALIAYKPIIGFLSAEKVEPSIFVLISFLFGGFVICVTSLYIQGTTDEELLSYRFKASAFMTLINLLSTWILLPYLGISSAYLMTGISTAIYFFILYLRKKNISS
jgi:O-antigen/teichoic acid export membrane protein